MVWTPLLLNCIIGASVSVEVDGKYGGYGTVRFLPTTELHCLCGIFFVRLARCLTLVNPICLELVLRPSTPHRTPSRRPVKASQK
ncbi:hypothetical protein V8F20_011333 [Naviculisporaceae sp. PSN 640]